MIQLYLLTKNSWTNLKGLLPQDQQLRKIIWYQPKMTTKTMTSCLSKKGILLEVLQTTKTFLTSHSCLAVPNNYIRTPNKNGHLKPKEEVKLARQRPGGRGKS